ncbi:hypothetical protein CHS0354_006141 [Potamilus streckersoni]|uniref:Uncharacterized protein n=1 Tax=Potamilus streckersoni TaxID=2493646 RepID=A0AAE0STR2_9BIVA|nr:hypothetical protein CHS0354_006141 [Potamilus streckersoni]
MNKNKQCKFCLKEKFNLKCDLFIKTTKLKTHNFINIHNPNTLAGKPKIHNQKCTSIHLDPTIIHASQFTKTDANVIFECHISAYVYACAFNSIFTYSFFFKFRKI